MRDGWLDVGTQQRTGVFPSVDLVDTDARAVRRPAPSSRTCSVTARALARRSTRAQRARPFGARHRRAPRLRVAGTTGRMGHPVARLAATRGRHFGPVV
jgi:hypothetical protein